MLTSYHATESANVSRSIICFVKQGKGDFHLHRKLLTTGLRHAGRLTRTEACCKLTVLRHIAGDNHITTHSKYINDMFDF